MLLCRYEESPQLEFDNQTEYENTDVSKNLLSINEAEATVDVPPRFTSIAKYRATLGHKVGNNRDYMHVIDFEALEFNLTGCCIC
jgi:hypothetical protein